MAVTVSASLLFLALTGVGVYFKRLHLGWALVGFLAGFFTASTGAAPVITNVISSLIHAFNHH